MCRTLSFLVLGMLCVVSPLGCSGAQGRNVLEGGVANFANGQRRSFKSLKGVREEKSFEKTTMHVEDILLIEKYSKDKSDPSQRNRKETQISLKDVEELTVEAVRKEDHKSFYDERWKNIDKGNNFAYFEPTATYPATVTLKLTSGQTESFRVESLILGVHWQDESGVEFFRFWPESERVTFTTAK